MSMNIQTQRVIYLYAEWQMGWGPRGERFMAVPVQLAPSSHMLSVKWVQVWKGKRGVLPRSLEQSIFSSFHKKLKERGILGGDPGILMRNVLFAFLGFQPLHEEGKDTAGIWFLVNLLPWLNTLGSRAVSVGDLVLPKYLKFLSAVTWAI